MTTIERSATRMMAWLLCAVAAVGMASATTAVAADTVLVIGATGGTGREVVKQAQAKGFAVRALVRDETKAREMLGAGIELIVGDVRAAGTLDRAMKGADYVVSALGSNSRNDPTNKPELIDYGAVRAAAEAATKARVKQIVLVSSMGVTDPDAPLNRMFDNILLWKFKGEEAVRNSGVPYTIVRPGGLSNDAGGQKLVKVMQGDPRDVRGRIPRADVAAICVNALGRKDAQRKTMEVLSDKTSGAVDWSKFFGGLTADVR